MDVKLVGGEVNLKRTHALLFLPRAGNAAQ